MGDILISEKSGMAAASQGLSMSSSSHDNGRENFRERLLDIDYNLGDLEVEQLKFLCQDLISRKNLEKCSSASDIFEHLLAGKLLSEEDPFLLAELLYIIKQNSLLKYLHYTKEQVENLLPTKRKVSLFRNLLYEMSENIDSDILKSMIFLQKESMPKMQMTSLSFLGHLEKQAQIGEDDVKVLEDLCAKVAPSLGRKIEKYKKEKAFQVVTSRVDKETESLPQGKEEVFSCSDVQQFLGALPVSSLFCNSVISKFREGFSGVLPSLKSPVYKMDRKCRGQCVIINNHSFTVTSLSERRGTQKDAECLTHVFKWLGFNVNIYNDVTKENLEEVLIKFQSHPDHADGDCFVFCVLTHGKFGAVYSSDGVLIPIREIMSHFTALQCPGLADKPKLFFIQACQGEEIQLSVSIEADAINPEPTHPPLQNSVPNEADFLLGLATVPGYVSFRHTTEGSWYIQSLYNHLKDLVPRHEDILSILTAVNDDVSRRGGTRKQMPQPAFTLRKILIFPVPQEEL
ncbi:caspase-10 isoform X2 [Pteropus medius]|uniref:caspase-10 isoform X2 n=1 Tax=Pteropus vampyrus TaxID=132908 RepID=UPI00196B37A5|nr:caspase-10 isoform X2 [Pteropus giganteus]